MIDKPQIGVEYRYRPNRGQPLLVRCKGFRKGWIECDGVKDGQHRSISRKQLFNVE